MLDARILGGTLIDGSGAPRRRGDVGIAAGRVVALGQVDEPAHRTVDASGLVVSPGFVDPHTHLDVQLLWDPVASPSLYHGVTTVLGGNCGFTVAPLGADPGSAEYVRAMLARVEGMPLEALRAGADWSWGDFGDWLARFEGRIAPNAGFLAGHSTLRRAVMGPRAVGEPATPEDITALVGALHQALDQGALGWSTSLGSTHHDGDGRPVPSRAARDEELVAMAAALADRPGTLIGINPGLVPFDDATRELLVSLATTSRRPVTWNALIVDSTRPEMVRSAREVAAEATARGGSIVAQVVPDPRRFYLSFESGFILDAVPGWAEVFALDPPRRLAALGDPVVRDRLRAGLADPALPDALARLCDIETMTLVETTHPAHRDLTGRTVGEIAHRVRADPLDAMLDVVVANGLATPFTPPPAGDDPASWGMRAELWRDPTTVIGAADAGAHLDAASSFTYTTSLIGPSVRERGLISLEEAVHQLTEVPARLCGVPARGTLAVGHPADLVVFDPDTVGPAPVHTRADLPAGARRLYAEADGIAGVWVNGVEVVAGGDATGATPGRVLRPPRRARPG